MSGYTLTCLPTIPCTGNGIWVVCILIFCFVEKIVCAIIWSVYFTHRWLGWWYCPNLYSTPSYDDTIWHSEYDNQQSRWSYVWKIQQVVACGIALFGLTVLVDFVRNRVEVLLYHSFALLWHPVICGKYSSVDICTLKIFKWCSTTCSLCRVY